MAIRLAKCIELSGVAKTTSEGIPVSRLLVACCFSVLLGLWACLPIVLPDFLGLHLPNTWQTYSALAVLFAGVAPLLAKYVRDASALVCCCSFAALVNVLVVMIGIFMEKCLIPLSGTIVFIAALVAFRVLKIL